jgi:FHA domain.
LECIAGPNKGDIIDFVYKVVLKGLVYRIGRAKYDTDYQIDDITVSNVHCSFGFDKNGWYIYEEKPTVFGTHIFLPNYEQWKNQHSSFSHVLEDGMKLCVEDFIFNCSVKPQIRAGSEELYERYKASMARMQQE